MIGTRLGNRYEVVREIGRGGMGVVYAARDPVLDREVAVKLLSPGSLTDEARERFRAEARIVAAMDHPAIVSVYDVGEFDGGIFLVMSLVPGANLRRYLERQMLSDLDILDVGIQVAEALDHSHSRGVVHRDIKPENIIVARDGENRARVRLTDFGLAVTSAQKRWTRAGSIVGSLSYLAPEQIRRALLDARTDVYSLGTVLFECFARRLPFDDDFPGVLYSIQHERPPDLASFRPDLPAPLTAVVMSCIESVPQNRPAAAREVAEMLRGIKADFHPADRRTRIAPVLIHDGRIVGRSAELRQLRDRLDRAKSSDAQLVVIGGESGIGKTRLLEELKREAAQRSMLVLQGRFFEQDRGFPFEAFCEAIQEYFAKGSGGGQFAELAADLVALFPVLQEIEAIRAHLTPEDEERRGRLASTPPDRARVFEQLSRAFVRIAAGRPLLLLLEELHVADVSIDALQFLFRRFRGTPVMMVATYRTEDAGKGHPIVALMQNLRGDPNFLPINLGPLSANECDELIATLLRSRTVDPAVLEKIRQSGEGNPFFTTELVKAMVESKALFLAADGKWQISRRSDSRWDELPATIQETVERRIQRLPEAERRILEIASVLGRRFDLVDLEALLGDDAPLDEVVQSLLDSGLIEEERELRGDIYTFSSNAIRDVLYAGISRRRRKGMHLQHVANLEKRYLSRLDRVLPELLHHSAEGDASEKVFEYGLQLARRYVENLSAEDAIRVAKVVLEFVDEDAEEERAIAGEANHVIAASHRLLGNTDATLKSASGAFEQLEASGGSSAAARVARLAAEAAWERRRLEEARRWVERGIVAGRKSGSQHDLRKLLTLSATIANVRGDHVIAKQRLEEAEALGETEPARISGTAPAPALVNLAVNGELDTLDPSVSFTVAQSEILPSIFETLLRATGSAHIEPWLVESMQVTDSGMRYHFRLRDVRFHDGTPVTPADVAYSFEHLLRNGRSEHRYILGAIRGARAVAAAEAERIDGFELLSEREFSIELERPIAFFPALLTNGATAIIPAGAARFGGNWREGCVGTGPFRVKRFEPGRKVELEANPFYWRSGLPKCQNVVFNFGLTPDEILDGFTRGRYAVAWDLYPSDVELLRADRQFAANYREVPELSAYYLVLNANRGPLRDIELRRELIAALRVSKLVESYVGREGIRATGLIPPGLLGHEPMESDEPVEETTSRFGRADATELKVMLNSVYKARYAKFAQHVFEALESSGFALRMVEGRSEYFPNQSAALAAADICLTRWVADYPDAHDFVAIFHSTRGLIGQLCGRDDLDRLVERGEVESSPAIRHEIYREIETIIREQALILPLFYAQAYRFARPEVEGFEINLTAPVVSYECLSLRL